VIKPYPRREKGAALALGSVCYALFYALGSQIDQFGVTAPGTTLVRFALAFAAACAALYALFSLVLPKIEFSSGDKEKRPFLTIGAFLLIFASYVPLFLIEFPGSLMYDIQAQTFQIARSEYSMFHPLAHTLLIRACIGLYDVLGSFERCAAAYSVLSMTMMAAPSSGAYWAQVSSRRFSM
jgi:hypothetical protein